MDDNWGYAHDFLTSICLDVVFTFNNHETTISIPPHLGVTSELAHAGGHTARQNLLWLDLEYSHGLRMQWLHDVSCIRIHILIYIYIY
jgi:hypothetical protein